MLNVPGLYALPHVYSDQLAFRSKRSDELNFYQVARALKRSNRRHLVAADPALITHLETSYLARGTDWRSVAARTKQWMNAGARNVIT